jgi:conjugative transfer signal peptidase TraF
MALTWGVGLIFVLGSLSLSGLMINTTHSIPAGFYRSLPQKEPGRGDYVAYCPAENENTKMALSRGYYPPGNCPARSSRVFKRVVALAGDHVLIDADRVSINGAPLPHSAQITADNLGRPLPQYRFNRVLSANEVLLMTNSSPTSFDGRYFGPVDQDQIISVIQPIKTWSRK